MVSLSTNAQTAGCDVSCCPSHLTTELTCDWPTPSKSRFGQSQPRLLAHQVVATWQLSEFWTGRSRGGKMSTDGTRKQFWKRNAAKVPGSIQHVYGAQHPPFDPLLHANLIKAANKHPPATPGKPKKATTFQEFESITSDAWDVGDDDDELLAMAAQNLNIEVVMETANKVIENHSKQQEQQRLDDSTDLEQRDEDTQDETVEDEEEDEENEEKEVEERVEEGDVTSPEVSFASQSSPYTDGRLVKSHSEAPIGSPKDAAGEYAGLQRQRSLPHRPPLIPLVARMADQNTSGTPAMTEREASRLDKFKQLLAGPNTDL
ncbi:unnamed protein product, partial [Pleuronectes platessa]